MPEGQELDVEKQKITDGLWSKMIKAQKKLCLCAVWDAAQIGFKLVSLVFSDIITVLM